MPDLKIKNLNKSFAGKSILKNISFETGNGELVVVLGPSGCGKSTLLRLIAGLESPEGGEIYIGEKRVDTLPPQKRNVALVFQNYALYPHMTVAQNLAFPLKISRVSKEEIRDRVKSTAELIGLADRLDSRPTELSGGQRQRVALGRAIIRKPDLFLLDEPLSNLDADLRQNLRHELVDLQRKLGTTTIYVTHDQVEAMTMGDRMIVIESGKIRQIGTPEEVYNSPSDIFVASFLGAPKINLIECEIKESKIQPFEVSTQCLPNNFLENPAFDGENSRLICGIRPEDIILSAEGKHSGTIKNAEFLGDKIIVFIDFNRQIISAIADADEWKKGLAVNFSLKKEKLLFFDKMTGCRICRP